MKTLIRQALGYDVQLDQENKGGKNTIYLTDADVARIIQVRYQFERFGLNDLRAALEQWQASSGVAQVSYELLSPGLFVEDAPE